MIVYLFSFYMLFAGQGQCLMMQRCGLHMPWCVLERKREHQDGFVDPTSWWEELFLGSTNRDVGEIGERHLLLFTIFFCLGDVPM